MPVTTCERDPVAPRQSASADAFTGRLSTYGDDLAIIAGQPCGLTVDAARPSGDALQAGERVARVVLVQPAFTRTNIDAAAAAVQIAKSAAPR